MTMHRKISVPVVLAMLASAAPVAASSIELLQRNFQNSRIDAEVIVTPGTVGAPGGVVGSSDAWVNNRPSGDAINGSADPDIATFDGFFRDRFMTIGDQVANLGDSNLGTSYVGFRLDIPNDLTSMTIGYDWVFDTNNQNDNSLDLDVFSVEFWAGTSRVSVLQSVVSNAMTTPVTLVSTTRGTFSRVLAGTELSDLLSAGVNQIRFNLLEYAGNNSSAVGIDNILITGIVPAPATLGLLAIGLASGAVARRRSRLKAKH